MLYRTHSPIIQSLLLGAALAVAAAAQQLPIKPADDPGDDPRRIDLRAVVDGTADFLIRGAQVRYQNQSGRPPVDAGSEYASPLPTTAVSDLRIEKKDGRGDILILEQPSVSNNWTLRLRIADPKGGDDRYHVRITWSGPTGDDAGVSAEGYGQVSELSVSADGRGFFRSLGRAENLGKTSISLTPAGRAIISFPGIADSRFEGSWSYSRSNRIQLDINRAMGATGTGRGEIRMNGSRFTRLTMEGSATGHGNFEVSFDQSGAYTDFVNPSTPTGTTSGAPPEEGIRAPRPGRPGRPVSPSTPVAPTAPRAPARVSRDDTVRAPRPGRRAASSASAVITEMDRNFSARGYIEAARLREDDVREVAVHLENGGEARLELWGGRNWTVQGRWFHNGSNVVTVGLTEIDGQAASGSAVLTVARGANGVWDVEKLTVDGDSARTGRLQVRLSTE